VITLKIPYQAGPEFQAQLSLLRKQQSSLIMLAYNWMCRETKKGTNPLRKNFYAYAKALHNLTTDSWLIYSAYDRAKTLFAARKGGGVIFGGKLNWIRLIQGKITKEQWKKERLMPFCSTGESNQRGNRNFHIKLESKTIHCRLSGQTFEIKLGRIGRRYTEELAYACLRAEEMSLPLTFQVTDTHVCITFEQKRSYVAGLNQNRIMGIDTNPNSLGWVILEFEGDKFNAIRAGTIDISKLNYKPKGPEDAEYQANKRRHEILQVSKHLVEIAKHHLCSKFAIEDLAVLSKNHGKGHRFNRLVNNSWCRHVLFGSIARRCETFGLTLVRVNPVYSSLAGNVLYDLPDPAAAAMEIARRGFRKHDTNWLLPKLPSADDLRNRWNEIKDNSWVNWAELSVVLKTLGIRYRRSSLACAIGVYRFCSSESSNIISYRFTLNG
jgi:IS605 OrfB family transposase